MNDCKSDRQAEVGFRIGCFSCYVVLYMVYVDINVVYSFASVEINRKMEMHVNFEFRTRAMGTMGISSPPFFCCFLTSLETCIVKARHCSHYQ